MYGQASDFTDRLGSVIENYSLTAADTTLAATCQSDAYNTIVAALRGRGLSDSQVALWTQGLEFELDLATYYFCQRKGMERRQEEDRGWLKQFDRRKELAEAPILLTDGTVITTEMAADLGTEFEDLDDINQDLA